MNFKSIFSGIFGNSNSYNSNLNIGMKELLADSDKENQKNSTKLQNTNELNTSELKQRILAKVKVNKITNSNYFRIYNIFLILTILVLSSFSIFLLAGFLADFNEINTIYDDFWINFWQNSFLEFVLLASFIGILIYVIYRQTDWILVRHKRILIAGILIFITVFGILGSFFIKKHLETLQNVENLSYRRNRIANLGQKMKEKNIFIGKITEINKDQNWLKMVNNSYKQEIKIFYWQNEISKEKVSEKTTQNNPNINSIPNLGNNLRNSVGSSIINSENNNLEKKRKQRKNQNKPPNQNWNQIIEKLEIGERILVYFEQIEDKMVIIDLRIL